MATLLEMVSCLRPSLVKLRMLSLSLAHARGKRRYAVGLEGANLHVTMPLPYAIYINY